MACIEMPMKMYFYYIISDCFKPLQSLRIGICSLQRRLGNPHLNIMPERIICRRIWRTDAAAFANVLLMLLLLCGHGVIVRWSHFLPFTVTLCCTITIEYCGKVNYSLRAFVIFPLVLHLIFNKVHLKCVSSKDTNCEMSCRGKRRMV